MTKGDLVEKTIYKALVNKKINIDAFYRNEGVTIGTVKAFKVHASSTNSLGTLFVDVGGNIEKHRLLHHTNIEFIKT
jgi:hypothetical protein